jgi:hypothetical protein
VAFKSLDDEEDTFLILAFWFNYKFWEVIFFLFVYEIDIGFVDWGTKEINNNYFSHSVFAVSLVIEFLLITDYW